MHFFHRYLSNARIIRSEDLILAGGAAGIAAAFNTPLAGVAFAVEELGRKLESRLAQWRDVVRQTVAHLHENQVDLTHQLSSRCTECLFVFLQCQRQV